MSSIWLHVGLVVLAVLYFVVRAVSRGLAHSGDLTYGYAAAHAWLAGRDPYDAAVLEEFVVSGGGPVIPIAIGHGVYPPTAFPLFVPLGLVDWPAAVLVGVAVNVVATLIVALGLVRLLDVPVRSARGLGIVAFILALAPVHTTLAFGQTGLVATAALVGGMLMERSGRSFPAGLAFALAGAVKAQIGLPFVAYLVWRRRWRAVLGALVGLSALTAIGIARLHVAGIPWLDSLSANLAWLSGPDGNAFPGPGNPDRFSLIHLQYLVHSLRIDRLPVDLIAFGVVAAASLWLVSVVRGRYGQELVALSTVAVLTLLVTYHRYYDAVLLAVPIAWGISELRSSSRRQALIVLGLCATFLVPGQTGLHDLSVQGAIPVWLEDSPIWETVLLTQHVWALLLMLPALLWAATRRGGEVGAEGARHA